MLPFFVHLYYIWLFRGKFLCLLTSRKRTFLQEFYRGLRVPCANLDIIPCADAEGIH